MEVRTPRSRGVLRNALAEPTSGSVRSSSATRWRFPQTGHHAVTGGWTVLAALGLAVLRNL